METDLEGVTNKYLVVQPKVRLTTTIIPVIEALEPYFESAKLKAFVTSGERTSEDQLLIIRMYAKRYEVDKEFPEILTCGVNETIQMGVQKIWTWQRAWSRLLNKNVIINPPRPAKCLFDYMRNGVNKKGVEIGYSPHFYGRAFDIGGGVDHDISNELKIIERAYKDKIPGFKGYLPERNNNAIHIDCI
jgi:hypothetical protein